MNQARSKATDRSRFKQRKRRANHAGVEELHLLHGELWIDSRKLYPGDYHRAEAARRIWKSVIR
ncbi:MAG: hypothetical protein JWO04_4128 [Gammaproteobacteria bacterium]|nr:hypothetical protein [Gammaproteobacteria bacterium]